MQQMNIAHKDSCTLLTCNILLKDTENKKSVCLFTCWELDEYFDTNTNIRPSETKLGVREGWVAGWTGYEKSTYQWLSCINTLCVFLQNSWSIFVTVNTVETKENSLACTVTFHKQQSVSCFGCFVFFNYVLIHRALEVLICELCYLLKKLD